MRTAHQHTQQQQQHTKKSASLFSCAFFRKCTDSPLSPTPSHTSPPHLSPSLSLQPRLPQLPQSNYRLTTPPPPPPLPPPPRHHSTKASSSSSSSSSSASHSFTQWRFPPTFHEPNMPPPPLPEGTTPTPLCELNELFHMVGLHFTCGSESDRLAALHMMERTLVRNPQSGSGAVVVPTVVMDGVIGNLKEHAGVKSATKILLALCLAEGNRHVAIECGAAARVVDALPDLQGSEAERALAALDLMCTVPEGAAQVRSHALAVPMLVAVMGRMEGRGREYTISVLAAVYAGGDQHLWAVAPAEEVARAVVLAMQQGDCSARGQRKGALLLKVLKENGQVDITQ